MLKRLPPQVATRCLADAAASPMARDGVAYPGWYLQRWHFLPEGYLSRRSVAAYEAGIRNLYNVASEGHVLRALARRLRVVKPARVLEMGCGPGRCLAALRRALPAAELTGVDLSPFMLELARDRLAATGGATLVHADARETPFETGAFDAITATHLIGHLPRGAAAEACAEARRLLSPGGWLLIVDHAWHPRGIAGFRSEARERLLGGLNRLELFVRTQESRW